MTKAELEAHAKAYTDTVRAAQERIATHQFKSALADCVNYALTAAANP